MEFRITHALPIHYWILVSISVRFPGVALKEPLENPIPSLPQSNNKGRSIKIESLESTR